MAGGAGICWFGMPWSLWEGVRFHLEELSRKLGLNHSFAVLPREIALVRGGDESVKVRLLLNLSLPIL